MPISLRDKIARGIMTAEAAEKFARGASASTRRKWKKAEHKGKSWHVSLGRFSLNLFALSKS